MNSLIDELGYYQYGNYTEDATLISVGSTSYGYDSGTYISYHVTFKMNNGRELDMDYKVYDGETDKSSSLVENGNYTITFDVNEGIVNGFEFLLKDFNQK